ncbi:MmgE/PrpD family protein [Utexia brackfieldae]|uniref:hypothetical protein n=1 Tax=Utexia brackfieldae TaxID=3074108 RepID=UPI00370D65E5
MAIAATQSAGLRLHFGSDIKPLHAGLAAQQAVLAVELCQYGLQANPDFLAEDIGFLALYGQGNAALNLSDWGANWRIGTPGLWFKNYPYCSANAYVVDAMQLILAQHSIDFQHIDRVNLIFPVHGDAALIYRLPKRQDQGRFSAEYVIACLLQHKRLDETAFQPVPIDETTTCLMHKIVRQYHDSPLPRFAQIDIYLSHQHCVSARVEHPKGSPANPYSQREIRTKLTRAIGSDERAGQLVALSEDFHTDQPVQQIVKQLQRIIC